jgi:hypothetical protein
MRAFIFCAVMCSIGTKGDVGGACCIYESVNCLNIVLVIGSESICFGLCPLRVDGIGSIFKSMITLI